MSTNTNPNPPAVPLEGFKSFFLELVEGTNIPKVSSQTLSTTQEEITIVDDYVDLGAIQSQCKDMKMTTIFTDVLCISTQVSWGLQDQSLSIYARRIEVKVSGDLKIIANFNTDFHAAVLMIFASEIEGTINCYGEYQQLSDTQQFTINQSSIGTGKMMRFDNGAVFANLQTSEGLPLSGITTSFKNYLTNEFILGAMCMDSHQGVALAMLRWTQQWLIAASDSLGTLLTDLYLQSASLINLISAELSAKASGATWVPHLSNSVYASIAGALSGEVSSYMTKYTSLMATDVTTQGLTQMMSAFETVQNNTAHQLQSLLTQAGFSYQSAQQSVQTAETNFSGKRSSLAEKANYLTQVGIPEYKEHLAFQVLGDLISFSAGIATALSGQRGPAAFKEVAKTEKAIAKVASISYQLASGMRGLDTSIKVTNQIYQSSTSIYSTISDMSSSGPSSGSGNANGSGKSSNSSTLVGELPSGSDMINVDASWDTFKIHADNSLATYISDGVDGAQAYQEAIDDLVVYGKALQNAKNAAAQASQKVADLQIQINTAIKNKESINDKINNFTGDQVSIIDLQQAFYSKILDTKLLLFSLLKSYQNTYYYWALEPSGVQMSLKNIASLSSNLDTATELSFDQYKQLLSLGNKTEQLIHFSNIVIDDPNVLTSLQNTGKAQWQLPLSNSILAGLNRVRFNTIRIWLDGNGLYSNSSSQTVKMKVQSSGVYQDRLEKRQFVFNSACFDDTIAYDVSNEKLNADRSLLNGLYAKMEIDGKSPIDESNCFFEPTPFTEWSIDLTQLGNEIAFNNIDSITMEFVGSAIT